MISLCLFSIIWVVNEIKCCFKLKNELCTQLPLPETYFSLFKFYFQVSNSCPPRMLWGKECSGFCFMGVQSLWNSWCWEGVLPLPCKRHVLLHYVLIDLSNLPVVCESHWMTEVLIWLASFLFLTKKGNKYYSAAEK